MSDDTATVSSSRAITVTINGTTYEREVEARKLLIHFVRDDLDLTGSHIGCDTGNCGACSMIVDGTLVKSCMMLAVQADGATIETVEGLASGDELSAAPAGVPRAPRAPVRLLHAGDADERDRAAAREPEPVRGRDQEGAPGQHLPLHRLLEHHRGRQGGGEDEHHRRSPRSASRPQKGWAGQSVPRKEDKRLLAGRGRLRRRHQAARDGLHPLRPLAVRARAHHLDRRLQGRGDQGRLRDAHRRGGRVAHRSVLPALDAARRAPQGLRARRRQGALRRRGGRGRRRRDARARARRLRARRDRVRAARRGRRRAPRAGRRGAGAPRRRRLEPDVGGRLRVGRRRRRVRRGRQGREDLRAPLPPLQLDPARDRRRRRRVQPRRRAVDDPLQQPVPRLRRDHDGPGDARRPRQAALRHPGHRRRLRQQDHLAPAARRLLPARPQARAARQLDGVAHRLPPLDVARERALVPRHRGRGRRATGRCSASGRRRSTTRARGCATSRSAA